MSTEPRTASDTYKSARKTLKSASAAGSAVGTLLTGTGSDADQHRAASLVGKGMMKGLLSEATGNTRVLPIVAASLFAPFFAVMALAHHLVYYDFGPRSRVPVRLAAVVAPFWLYVMITFLPEADTARVWIWAGLPAAVVVLAYAAYTHVRRSYPPDNPAWIGRLFVGRLFGAGFEADRPAVAYGLIGPTLEFIVFVICSFVLLPIAEAAIVFSSVGMLVYALQLLGIHIGLARGRKEARRESHRAE